MVVPVQSAVHSWWGKFDLVGQKLYMPGIINSLPNYLGFVSNIIQD